MGRNEPFKKNGRAKAKQNVREGGFAFARLMFLKFGGIWVSAPQEGAGGMRGGDFFGGGGYPQIKYKTW